MPLESPATPLVAGLEVDFKEARVATLPEKEPIELRVLADQKLRGE